MGQALGDHREVLRKQEQQLFRHWLRSLEEGLKHRVPGTYAAALLVQSKLVREIAGHFTQAGLVERRSPWIAIRAWFGMPAAGQHGAAALSDNLDRIIQQKRDRAEAIQVLLNRYGGKGLEKVAEPGATPERRAKPQQQDSVERLYEKMLITDVELAAARSIARIFEAGSKAHFTKIGRMESAGRAPQGGWREPEMGWDDAILRNEVYIPWTEEIRAMDASRMDWLIDVIVYSHSVKEIAKQQGRAWDTILALLRGALQRYDERLRRFRAGVRKQPDNFNEEGGE
jgi:hypothetical protein